MITGFRGHVQQERSLTLSIIIALVYVIVANRLTRQCNIKHLLALFFDAFGEHNCPNRLSPTDAERIEFGE